MGRVMPQREILPARQAVSSHDSQRGAGDAIRRTDPGHLRRLPSPAPMDPPRTSPFTPSPLQYLPLGRQAPTVDDIASGIVAAVRVRKSTAV